MSALKNGEVGTSSKKPPKNAIKLTTFLHFSITWQQFRNCYEGNILEIFNVIVKNFTLVVTGMEDRQLIYAAHVGGGLLLKQISSNLGDL